MEPRSSPSVDPSDAAAGRSVSPTDSGSSTRPKRRRQTSGLGDCCRTCRLRKVKCTGPAGDGPCSNCARLELACSFTAVIDSGQESEKVSRTTPSRSHTEAGTLRKRAQRACSQCHAHKTKCSGEQPKCKRCELAGLNCEYTPARRKFSNLPFQQGTSISTDVASSSAGSQHDSGRSPSSTGRSQPSAFSPIETGSFTVDELLARKDFLLRHFDTYMEYIYPVPTLGIFHPRTTYHEIQDGTLRPVTAAALCSVAAFFVSPSDSAAREFAAKCAEIVEFHLLRTFGNLSESNVILFVLSFAYNAFIGQYGKSWQSQALVSRLALGLQLNYEAHPDDPRRFIQREINRRLVWQIFMNDRHLAGGFEEFILLREEHMKLRLPCSDRAFRDGNPVVMERLSEAPAKKAPGGPSIPAYCVRLLNIRHHILAVTKQWIGSQGQKPSQSRMEPSRVMEGVNTLQNEITRFSAALPDSLKLTDQNLSSFLKSAEWTGYFMIHVWISQLHIDLYRFALPGLREQAHPDLLRKLPKDFITKSQKQAVAYALNLARLFATIQNDYKVSPASPGFHWLVPCVGQVAKVLMKAIQYQLYRDLGEHTTAPLWRNDNANDFTLRSLIDTSLRMVEPWAKRIPASAPMYEYTLQCLKDFESTRKLDERNKVGMAPVPNDGSMKLPGPMLILEAALLEKGEGDKVAGIDAAAASKWFQQLPEVPDTLSPEEELEFEMMRPEMPLVLAQARGIPVCAPLYGEGHFQTVTAGPTSQPPPGHHSQTGMQMGGAGPSRIVPINNFNLMTTSSNHPVSMADSLGMLALDPTGDTTMLGAPPGQMGQFGVQQQGMYLQPYGGQYHEGGEQGDYHMHQHGYG